MQATRARGFSLALPAVRWGARILSAACLVFWGGFLVAHLVGEEARASRPLVWQDSAILAALGASLVGLAVAWKWELPGGVLTLAAVAVCAFFNWRVLAFPGTLIPIAAVMFLTSGWMSRPPRKAECVRPAAADSR